MTVRTCITRAALLGLLVISSVTTSLAHPGLQITCRGRGPIQQSGVEPFIWEAVTNQGLLEDFDYFWRERRNGTLVPVNGDGGNNQPTVVTYPQPRIPGDAYVELQIYDRTTGQFTRQGCSMPILPDRTLPPYNTPGYDSEPLITPIVWFPAGVSLNGPAIENLRRTMRIIRARYFQIYGKTFKMRDIQTVQSTRTEVDICGTDCTDIYGGADILTWTASAEMDAALNTRFGLRTRYSSATLKWAWGGGSWSGAESQWEIAAGHVGDATIAAAAGINTDIIDPNYGEVQARDLGNFWGGPGTAGHELNHAVGWDDPHDFGLYFDATDYEKRIALAGPYLTESLEDPVFPTINVISPTERETVSGNVTINVNAADNDGIDAVLYLAANRLIASVTTAPYSLTIDTTKLPFGPNTISALAVDRSGNFTRDDVVLDVRNIIAGSTCSNTFPAGYFEACIYNGINGSSGTFLGKLRDYPFPQRNTHTGYLINHPQDGTTPFAFGKFSQLSGVWRGRISFPNDRYLFRVNADDGVRVRVNGQLKVDKMVDGFNSGKFLIDLNGPADIQVEWYQNAGLGSLSVFWQRFHTDTQHFTATDVTLISPTSSTVQIEAGQDITFVANVTTDEHSRPYTLSVLDPRMGNMEMSGTMQQNPFIKSSLKVDGRTDQWTIRWRPALEDAGKTWNIGLVADDALQGGDSVTIPVNVTYPEKPAFLLPIGSTTFTEEQVNSIIIQARDYQDNTLTYSTSGLPSGATFTLLGDVNLDRKLDSSDVAAASFGRGRLADNVARAVADVNRDFILDQTDVDLIAASLTVPEKKYVLAWKPRYLDAAGAPYQVTISARDSGGATAQEVMALNVNEAMKWYPIGPQIVHAGEVASFVLHAEDDRAQGIEYGTVFGTGGESPTVQTQPWPVGDVNMDGALDDTDLQAFIIPGINGQIALTPTQRILADATRDGILDADDFTYFFNILIRGIGYREGMYVWQTSPTDRGDFGVTGSAVTSIRRYNRNEPVRIKVIDPRTSVPLTGKVVRPNGSPLSGVEISLRTRSPQLGAVRMSVLTDSAGAFRFDSVPPGKATLRAKLTGYLMSPNRLTPTVPTSSFLKFTATPRSGQVVESSRDAGNIVTGKVTTPGGAPIAETTIKLRGLTFGNRYISLDTITEPSGWYYFKNIPDGDYRLYIRKKRVRFPIVRQEIFVIGGQVLETNWSSS